MEKRKIFMKSAGRRGYSRLARVMTLAVMLLTLAAGGAWAQEPTKYTVKMAENTVDKDKWTISPTEAAEGKPITATYSGTRHVKSVTAVTKAAAPAATVVDLSKLTADYEAQDGETLINTLGGNYKITIADGATVTLDGVTINGVNDSEYLWAGITCAGEATIILKGTNTVKGFYENYPGIYVPSGKTLTIQGDGSLTASPFDGGTDDSYGAGIGCGYQIDCGNITIAGGTINATGGYYEAGIGGGKDSSCGDITITGGTINATGGNSAAGIGSGYAAVNKTASCGNITIANTVTKVTATKGDRAPNSIGKGRAGNSGTNTCGTVTIGGTVYWEGSAYQNGGDTYLTTSPYTYQPAN